MTPDELQAIQQKMQQFGTNNFSAFVRKMAIDGYVIKLELPELKELVSLLRYSSNNLNQLTKRVHETGRIYDADLEDLRQSQERLWDAARRILDTLAKLWCDYIVIWRTATGFCGGSMEHTHFEKTAINHSDESIIYIKEDNMFYSSFIFKSIFDV